MGKKGKLKMNEQISLNQAPSIHYKKFFDRFGEIDSVKIDDWEAVHIISYFCRKYEQHYNEKYAFRFNSSAPGKSYEVFQFRKLAMILSASPTILKDFIDWFFIEKIIARKRRITSMAFLTDVNTVNEYKNKKLLMGNRSVDRSTVIPPIYSATIQKYGFAFKNYGELSFLKRCIDAGNGSEEHKMMLNELAKLGLDIASLDRVK